MYSCVYRGGALVLGWRLMWMTVFSALEKADSDSKGSGASAYCPHPSECLRMPLRECRSFEGGADTRRLMAQQFACNAIEPN